LKWAIACHRDSIDSIVKMDIKTPCYPNNQLLKVVVSMPAPLLTARNVIEIVDTLYFEGNVISTFNKCQGPPGVRNFLKLDLAY